MSSQMRYTPPSAALTRPTGIWKGLSRRCARKSAPPRSRAPMAAEATIVIPVDRLRRRANCGAASARKPIGPATATHTAANTTP